MNTCHQQWPPLGGGVLSKPLGHVCRLLAGPPTRESVRHAPRAFLFQIMAATRFVIIDGEKLSVMACAEKFKIPYRSLLYRVKSGWPIDLAVAVKTEPGRNKVFRFGARSDEERKAASALRTQQYRDRNRSLVREKDRLSSKNRRDAIAEKSARRRAMAKMATPSWSDRSKILEFYRASRKITKETGVAHHVDHIVPLNGKTVCGLHVHFNLQVLPSLDNEKKSNKTWPDMP